MRAMTALGIVVLISAFGCSSGEQPAEVSGTVLIDGVPLEDGEIIFESPDKSKTPAAGTIANGKYTARVLPGPKKVKIQGSRPTAKPDPVMGTAAREQRLGPEYNEKSTLTADVKPGVNEGVDFQVKELPKKK